MDINIFIEQYARMSDDDRDQFVKKLMLSWPELANQLANKIQHMEMDNEYRKF
jgi:hypothetical protein